MRRWITIAALLIVCGVFLLLWDSPPQVFLQSPSAVSEPELPNADGYMLNTHTITFTKTGEPSYELKTTETRYFKKGERFELDSPDMITFDSQSPDRPWHVTAKTGTVFQSGKKVALNGDVYAWQNTENSARNELRSQRLVLFPERQLAESNKRVVITTPEGRTTGTGLEANLQEERFKLLNNVKGLHRGQL